MCCIQQQELEVQKKHLKVAGEQLQTLLRDQRQFGRSNRMSSPHTIAQGMVAIASSLDLRLYSMLKQF